MRLLLRPWRHTGWHRAINMKIWHAWQGSNLRSLFSMWPSSWTLCRCLIRHPNLSDTCARCLQADIDAYTTEMEVIGAAYEDMQAKNSRLLQQLAEKDGKNSQVLTEKIQAQHQMVRLAEQQAQAEAARKLAEQQVTASQDRISALETRLQVLDPTFSSEWTQPLRQPCTPERQIKKFNEDLLLVRGSRASYLLSKLLGTLHSACCCCKVRKTGYIKMHPGMGSNKRGQCLGSWLNLTMEVLAGVSAEVICFCCGNCLMLLANVAAHFKSWAHARAIIGEVVKTRLSPLWYLMDGK